MNAKPKLLDLYCGEGGASAGYDLAGFDVTGVDYLPMKRYPYRFVQSDALEYLERHWREYDIIAASPPCQRYSSMRHFTGKEYPDSIPPLRAALLSLGVPYVIENVENAPLDSPITLCGTMFGLRLYRHRLLESNMPMVQPDHPAHTKLVQKMGQPAAPGEYYNIVGNVSGVHEIRTHIGTPWVSQKGLSQIIPPAYTRYVGMQILKGLK